MHLLKYFCNYVRLILTNGLFEPNDIWNVTMLVTGLSCSITPVGTKCTCSVCKVISR